VNLSRPLPVRGQHSSSGDVRWARPAIGLVVALCLLCSHRATAAELRVFVTEGYAPFESVDAHGHPEGLAVELMRWIALQRRDLLVFQHGSFPEALAAIEERRADVLLTVFRSRERMQKLSFTRPYLQIPTTIIVPARSTAIRGLADLDQRRVAVLDEDYAQTFLDMQQIQPQRLTVRDCSAGLKALTSGQVEALIGDSPAVWQQAVQAGLQDRIAEAGEPLYIGHLCFATRVDAGELAKELDTALATAISLGQVAKLENQWLTRPLVVKTIDHQRWLSRLLWIIAGIGTLATMVTLWLASVRREANRLSLHLLAAQKAAEAARVRILGARLLAGAAHDINHLLTLVTANAELLQRGGSVAKLTPTMVASACAAGVLLRRGLALAKGQAPQPRPMDVELQIRDIVRLFEPLARNCQVQTIDPVESCWALIDPSLIQSALLNLLLNARDAMPHGGRILVSGARRDDGRITISVHDAGTGIPPEVQQRLFEPFFTTKGSSGTGLGLLMVREAAQAHGGSVAIASTVGTGTTITIDVPACARPPSGPMAPVASGELLVIDDDATMQVVLRQILTSGGYHVTLCSNGEEALAIAGKPWSAVISDWTMPGLSGEGLIHALRAANPNIPILMCCGHPVEELSAIMALPQTAFLSKPFTSTQLLTAVAEVLKPRDG
jgi:two-component system, cell cycle sensor histidine kinase and response regulator CckA